MMSHLTTVASEDAFRVIGDLMTRLDILVMEGLVHGRGGLEETLQTPQGHDVLSALLADENRQALHAWYQRLGAMELNPTAAALQTTLEHRLGIQLGAALDTPETRCEKLP